MITAAEALLNFKSNYNNTKTSDGHCYHRVECMECEAELMESETEKEVMQWAKKNYIEDSIEKIDVIDGVQVWSVPCNYCSWLNS